MTEVAVEVWEAMQGQTQQATFPIAGMGCGGCAAKVEKLLSRSAGVLSAAVSFSQAEAVVEYDPALTDRRAILSLLAEAGYAAPAPGSAAAPEG